MSYLLDKKTQRKKFLWGVSLILSILLVWYFSSSIFNGLSFAGSAIFRPVLVLGNSVGKKFKSLNSFFISKNSLYLENEKLKSELNENKARMSDYDSVVVENLDLKNILGRNEQGSASRKMILAAILAKPNQSVYDTLIIDVGTEDHIVVGDLVLALGVVPIGRVAETYLNSAKVILFSNPGEKTTVAVTGRNVFMEVIGRGGGNFDMIMPKDFILTQGDQVVLPGLDAHLLGVVVTIIADPRSPFLKALLVSPINIQELKFVEVER